MSEEIWRKNKEGSKEEKEKGENTRLLGKLGGRKYAETHEDL